MRERHISPVRERWEGEDDDIKENSIEKIRDSTKHRSKDRSRSGRSEDKDHRSRDRERSKAGDVLSREKESKDSETDRTARWEGDKYERDKDRSKDKKREKDRDLEKYKDKEREVKDRKGRGKEREHDGEGEVEKENERSREKGRGKEKSRDRDKDKDRESERDRTKGREMEKDRYTDRYREKEIERYRDKDVTEKEKGNERTREKPTVAGQEKDRSRDEKGGQKHGDKDYNRIDEVTRDSLEDLERDYGHEKDPKQLGNGSPHHEAETSDIKYQQRENNSSESYSARDLEHRISRMREERLQKSEGASEILSWVSKSRKIGEKRISEKVKKLSKSFEEQDNINQKGSGDDEAVGQHSTEELGGFKVLHGLEKVIEGGAVVLTLKDQSILADGDINQEIDMLENVEIGEQKRRDEAYNAAKKKSRIYDDKFNDEPNTERKILPQYDDPVGDEGVTLDASGGFTGDAEKKLDELRKRINGVSANNRFEDLNSLGAITSDYYTHEEMLQFKKPKKKKSLRKKEKLDIDALEAEAISTGLGTGDLGSRNEGKRLAIKKEQEKSEAEMKNNAYQAAYAKADEASKALRLDQTLTMKIDDNENPVFDDDDDDLRKSLEKARKLALRNLDVAGPSGPKAIALLASLTASNSTADDQNPSPGELQENKVVFTEMEEFVWGLQLDNEEHKPDGEDVFMEEDVAPEAVGQEIEENRGWTEVKDSEEEPAASEDKDKIVPDETIHEVAVGKGLSGALKLLKDRGTLKETVEWGGRNMDKKKSKLVGIYDNDGQNAQREIRIERTDEYGRILTPKEAFRLLSHKFHGKGPGKMKQEKRMRQYQEDMKVKQMKNSDTPSLSVERMREAQAQLKTPYLVLSGNVKPGQTSDPRSGFATVENFPGGLTPMLGDRKVEHFLGIKRKAEHGDMGPPPPKQKR